MEILTKISAFFDSSVPFGVMAIIVYLALMSRDIKQIQKDLSNHITDTNKKIDNLRQDMKEGLNKQSDRIDKQSDRIDKQGDQFSKLYELLLRQKAQKS